MAFKPRKFCFLLWHLNVEHLNFCQFSHKRGISPLIKNAKIGQKINSRKVVGIVRFGCQLPETVGLLAVRLELGKLRLKNR